MHKVRNSDGSIMAFGDDTSPLDHERYSWRYENGQDIHPSMTGAPVEIRNSSNQLFGPYAAGEPVQLFGTDTAQREVDLMRPQGMPGSAGKYKGGTQLADVTVNLYPKSAYRLGHLGLQVDDDPGKGFYTKSGPNFGTLSGEEQPGEIRVDNPAELGKPRSHVIKTTHEQDRIIRDFIRKRFNEPGGYDLYLRNCQDFVSEALKAAGIKTKPGAYPNQWFNINFAEPVLKARTRNNY